MMRIDAGQLDRRIGVLNQSQTRDAAGQPQDSWNALVTLSGAKYALRDVEVRAQAGRSSEAELKWLVRYRSDLTTAMRLAVDGVVYAITGIQEIDRRVGLWLFARSLPGEQPPSATP